ncbi:MAG: hypothetical protein J5509_02360 [Lachnospiraceae bacterium]|nr:hypothetical protein [Lachnospiraceae bacterium]
MSKAHVNRIISVIILAAAIVMIIAGIADGGVRDVCGKAMMICMECIGIG